jgi:hypothetical protein
MRSQEHRTIRPTLIEMMKRAQRVAPVDVDGLAADLDVRVNYAWLDPDISGEIVCVSPGAYEINVNAAHPETRQRFTLAHELGHFVYHRDLLGEGLDDDRAYRSTKGGRFFNPRIGQREETQADTFAANLLMPYRLIEALRAENLGRREMARRLKVSEHALAIRLGQSYP